jgi:hypothetical protein
MIIEGSGHGYLRTACAYAYLNPVRASFLVEMANVANPANVANAASVATSQCGQFSQCGRSGECGQSSQRGQCSQCGQSGVPLCCGISCAAVLLWPALLATNSLALNAPGKRGLGSNGKARKRFPDN